jgi:Tfp pilus assembly protein PilO
MRSLQKQAEWCARVQWGLGMAVLVLVVGFYAAVYRPNRQRLDALNLQIDSSRQTLTGNRSRLQVLPEVNVAVAGMQSWLDQFDKTVPRLPEIGPFINDITEISHQAGLRKGWTVEPGVPTQSDSYREFPIALKFEGNFENVFSFLRQAELMKRLTRVKSLKVRSADAGKSGQVQVELSMNIYFSEG